ncbi:hypothetical protein J6590_062085 [Homalodisca vitripennis]|nr:hypothetical protein J6590_062085 [Homalodisca vitripennis]
MEHIKVLTVLSLLTCPDSRNPGTPDCSLASDQHTQARAEGGRCTLTSRSTLPHIQSCPL